MRPLGTHFLNRAHAKRARSAAVVLRVSWGFLLLDKSSSPPPDVRPNTLLDFPEVPHLRGGGKSDGPRLIDADKKQNVENHFNTS